MRKLALSPEFYAEIRVAHVAAVLTSGSLFVLRGILVQAGRSQWALAPLPRYLSYAVDTTLLMAALMLLTLPPAAAFGNGWLVAKLLLLPPYVVLGWFALRSGSGGRRLAAFCGALLAYVCMFAIARTHDPLAPLRMWLSG